MTRSSLILVVVAAVVTLFLRFVPVPLWNFSAMGALALLCGAVVRPMWLALAIPLGCRAITDVMLELRTGYGFYGSWMFDYAAYAMICFGGRLLQPRGFKAPLGGLASAALFFVISNFGVWLMALGGPGVYASNFSGLMECFAAGLPFIRGTLVGDVLFSSVFFGTLAWLEHGALSTRSVEPALSVVPETSGADTASAARVTAPRHR